jgi:hypothetical protein
MSGDALTPKHRSEERVLFDAIDTRLGEHRALCEMLAALFEIFETIPGHQDRSMSDEVWPGLTVVARHMSIDCAEAQRELERLAGLGGGR